MSDSTPRPRKRKADRPKKPYPDFPLTPHPCGAWQKKIRGRIYYFGRWGRVVNGKMERIPGDGWQAALEEYQRVADDLHAGRTPRVNWDCLTVAELCNRFLTAKLRKLEAGELGAQAFEDYRLTTDLIVSAFGNCRPVADLAADDFEKLRATMAERWGPVRLGNTITRVKSIFKYALDNGLLDKPVRCGAQFAKPDQAVLRRHTAKRGELMLEADQLRALLREARQPLKAMILLGINAGFGNADCATLPLSAVYLDAGWLDYPRPKTGIPRRCPLWPETVGAIREALAARPTPRDRADAECVFLRESGLRWVRDQGSRKDDVCKKFGELLKRLGMHRARVGFYTLRHTFRTIADAARDPVASDLIMGHTDPSMGSHYRERVEDSRLQAVVDHVHAWLFGHPSGNAPKERPDVSDPSDRPEQVESGTQDGEPDPPADSRPTLRLYVG
jgi:integrase